MRTADVRTPSAFATLWPRTGYTSGLPYKEGLTPGCAARRLFAAGRAPLHGPDQDTDAIMDALHERRRPFAQRPLKKAGFDEPRRESRL